MYFSASVSCIHFMIPICFHHLAACYWLNWFPKEVVKSVFHAFIFLGKKYICMYKQDNSHTSAGTFLAACSFKTKNMFFLNSAVIFQVEESKDMYIKV